MSLIHYAADMKKCFDRIKKLSEKDQLSVLRVENKLKRDAQRQYVVIGTLARIVLICINLLFDVL